jgi:hypothetical protein
LDIGHAELDEAFRAKSAEETVNHTKAIEPRFDLEKHQFLSLELPSAVIAGIRSLCRVMIVPRENETHRYS